ncbi:MAG: hypothetical protein ABJF50_12480 [Paracoccaceae bacterium]
MKTAKELGCPDPECDVCGQSAWHLTNRGLDGVDYTLRYLAALKRDDTLSRFALAPLAVDISDKINSGDRHLTSFLGVGAPLLLLPAASFFLNEQAVSDGILFSFNDQTVVYSKTYGLRIESVDPRGLMMIDPLDAPTCTASRVDFLKGAGQGIEFNFEKNEILAVPRSVFVGTDAALDLSALLS